MKRDRGPVYTVDSRPPDSVAVVEDSAPGRSAKYLVRVGVDLWSWRVDPTVPMNRVGLPWSTQARLAMGDLLPVPAVDIEPAAENVVRTVFAGGGVRDGAVKTERFELGWVKGVPYDRQMLTRYACWMARGAQKYADRNWESFASADALEHAKGSLLRHVFKFLAELDGIPGDGEDDNAAAIWFNVQACALIHERLTEQAHGRAA
ncbi:hypothetical protein AB0383_20175 [Amycolatopsis sp. NPDC051373]|uniref:hypothetical protein n=1 Tax=Amycolatopsis sp. NPDC051373 TaxID=3155801 RepID=UPI00344E8682